MSILGSPAFGLLANLLQGFNFNKKFDQFQAEQVDPANIYGRQTAEALGPVAPTTTLARDLYGRARDLVGDISTQEIADVNQRFNQLGESAQAGLRARGIGGSTVAPSVAYANERNRSDELRRVNDARLMRLLGVESTFGQGQIAANQAAADTRLQALQQRILIPPSQPYPIQIQPQFKP